MYSVKEKQPIMRRDMHQRICAKQGDVNELTYNLTPFRSFTILTWVNSLLHAGLRFHPIQRMCVRCA